jgi:hypothetical protein
MPRSDCEFQLDDLKDYFSVPAKQAAKKLNIGITKLKLVCRQLGTCIASVFEKNLGTLGLIWVEQESAVGPTAPCGPPRRSHSPSWLLECARKAFCAWYAVVFPKQCSYWFLTSRPDRASGEQACG